MNALGIDAGDGVGEDSGIVIEPPPADSGVTNPPRPEPCSGTTSLSEDFSGSIVSPVDWVTFGQETESPTANVDSKLNVSLLAYDGGASAPLGGIYTSDRASLTDKRMFVKVDSSTPQRVGATINISVSGPNDDGVERNYVAYASGTYFYFVYRQNDLAVVGDEIYDTIMDAHPFYSDRYVYWQFRVASDVLYFEVSENGETWLTLSQDSLDSADKQLVVSDARIFLYASNQTDVATSTKFDDFNTLDACE